MCLRESGGSVCQATWGPSQVLTCPEGITIKNNMMLILPAIWLCLASVSARRLLHGTTLCAGNRSVQVLFRWCSIHLCLWMDALLCLLLSYQTSWCLFLSFCSCSCVSHSSFPTLSSVLSPPFQRFPPAPTSLQEPSAPADGQLGSFQLWLYWKCPGIISLLSTFRAVRSKPQ